MAQYREIRTGYPQEFTSGGCTFRYRAEGGVLYIDKEIGGSGFSSGGVAGIEGVDWDSIDNFTLPAVSRNVFRIGTRDGYFVYDQEIDATGFDGTVAVNWDNIEEHSLAEPTTSTTSTSSTSSSTTTTTTYITFEHIGIEVLGANLVSINISPESLNTALNPTDETVSAYFTITIDGVPTTITGNNFNGDADSTVYLNTSDTMTDPEVVVVSYEWVGGVPLVNEGLGFTWLAEFTGVTATYP